MFDIGFSEIVVIAVVALIVIGPEKLPKTARTLGHLFGRLQRYVNEVKSDISREMELEELRKLQHEVQSAAKSAEESFTSATQQVESGLRDVQSQLNATAGETTRYDIDRPELEPLPPPTQPATSTAGSSPQSESGEPPRQASLPGFDRG
jgi:sec-independent protein translocase protein TatB